MKNIYKKLEPKTEQKTYSKLEYFLQRYVLTDKINSIKNRDIYSLKYISQELKKEIILNSPSIGGVCNVFLEHLRKITIEKLSQNDKEELKKILLDLSQQIPREKNRFCPYVIGKIEMLEASILKTLQLLK